MRGDWTLPSDAISAYLAGFGRYGIPFNAVYGPGAPQGLALPEILTRDAVLTALEQAAGGTATSARRSEEHTSELQSLMRISYAVFCLKKKKKTKQTTTHNTYNSTCNITN